MTNENDIPERIVMSLGRHISLGDYCNTETKQYRISAIDADSQQHALDILRIQMNIWERKERTNFYEMQHQKAEDEQAFHEKKRLEIDLKNAETRKEIFDFIEANPKCTIDSLVMTFQLSQMAIGNYIETLIRQGKIERAECREAFKLRPSDPRDDNDEPDDTGII